ALQLSDVLNYLHTIQPVPIVHRDLKPSNIIVTDDNKLVLIDFGISKQATDVKDAIVAVSKNYAAPEQFKGMSDERTDIFSYGVILYQLATRHLPNMPGFDALLKDSVSVEVAEIILKCLKADPEERYQSVQELREDLSKLNYSKIQNIKKAFSRTVMTGIAACFFVASLALGGGSYFEYTKLNKVELAVNPEVIFLTEQQRSDLYINQLIEGGKNASFDSRFVTWEYSDINIARIEANEIIAMNVGATEVIGTYRNKVIKLNVNVVKPDGMTDIRLKYNTNFTVTDYAGSGKRDIEDGTIKNCSMINPQSLDVAPDGSIYFVDSGYLRQIVGGEVATFEIDPPYIKPKLIKAISSSEMWFVSEEWQDEDGYFRGIIRVSDEGGFEGIYIVAASENDILDITANSKGEIFFLEQDMINEKCYIKHFTDIYQEPVVYAQVPYTSVSMTMDAEDNIYLADMENSVIYKYNETTKVCDYLAGVKEDKNFIDGTNARFYMPYKVKVYGDYLYVLDYNVLRRISIAKDSVFDVETVAGKAGFASPDDLREGKGYDVFFEKSRQRDMTITKDGVILISDPDLSIIRQVVYVPEKSEDKTVAA
ncbi:MAG: protein kinase, partial [Clostridia bacterium]|nr:protein kinase [Clostridia bacterium]